MSHTAPQRPDVAVGEVLVYSVSFADRLDDGELLTGTPTVTEVGTSDLTISNNVVSTGSLTINDITVITGEAIQFKMIGQLTGVSYRIKMSVVTDASPAQTKIGYVEFDTE